jgi:hypothetical protein
VRAAVALVAHRVEEMSTSPLRWCSHRVQAVRMTSGFWQRQMVSSPGVRPIKWTPHSTCPLGPHARKWCQVNVWNPVGPHEQAPSFLCFLSMTHCASCLLMLWVSREPPTTSLGAPVCGASSLCSDSRPALAEAHWPFLRPHSYLQILERGLFHAWSSVLQQ